MPDLFIFERNIFRIPTGLPEASANRAPSEKNYLLAMAVMGPGPHRSGDIATQLGSEVQTVAPTRAKLIEKGMIYSPAHGDTGFTAPLFDAYLRRVIGSS